MLLFWNKWKFYTINNQLRINNFTMYPLCCTNDWIWIHTCLQLVAIRYNYSLEQCSRGKSQVILEVKEVKPHSKKNKKLKTNSHTSYIIRIMQRKWYSTSEFETSQTKWLHYHKWLRYENNRMFCHFCQVAKTKNSFGGNKFIFS